MLRSSVAILADEQSSRIIQDSAVSFIYSVTSGHQTYGVNLKSYNCSWDWKIKQKNKSNIILNIVILTKCENMI